MSTQPINSLTSGQGIEAVYLLKTATPKLTNATPAKEYLDIVLSDKTGEIEAKLWDVTAVQKEIFKAPMLVRIAGNVHTYNDKLQLRINRIAETDLLDGSNMIEFVRSAPEDPDHLVTVIKQTAGMIGHNDIRRIVLDCIERAGRRLETYPAAKAMHHAYNGGLAYHTKRMLELGEYLITQRPFLNADLLRAGIILHDIAKTEEMTAELGVVQEYSTRGKLIGHISLASNWIVDAASRLGIELDSEPVMLLQHMVLSHHNLGEWGSPVQPQTPESVALHLIDQLDAKLQAAEDALSALSEGEEWTPAVPSLERKALYRSGLTPSKVDVREVWD
ncbi:3'-5' exoribonuclease YhaM family protein [Paenibacillus aurantiacus]|uniref:3'-5' exoribonuclease YhaM family protein n=1 Tax=Paenibacillus aurantiacus TaxID=1936118 RepID=A0ABV5L052_9BACL